jgi:hypothetical protein
MSSRSLFTLILVAAGVLAPAAIADAATTSAYPTISKIEPMKVSIGETMSITGKGFLKGKAKNTVVFRRVGKPNVFVKADGLSATRLTVKLPSKLESSLGRKAGVTIATRFQVRVLAKRFGKTFTKLSQSPTVLPKAETPVTPLTPATATTLTPSAAAQTAAAATPTPDPPADCDADGTPDSTDADDDNDLLIDTTEVAIGTNRCAADTDDDGMTDGWEYQSAIDRNQRSCPKAPAGPATHDYPKPCAAAMPYPGKRPYTNPLQADNDVDYDGDLIQAGWEFHAWQLKGDDDATYRAITGPKGMWYSDGKQASVDTAPDSPDDNDCVGMAIDNDLPFGGIYNRPEFEIGEGTGNYPNLESSPGVVKPEYTVYTPSRGNDECLNDYERDEDGDFLSNGEELTGPLSSTSWWNGNFGETPYDELYWGRPVFGGVNWLDADTDGDGVVDSLDDEDADDFLNIEELVRGARVFRKTKEGKILYSGNRTGLWVNPFNPCLPYAASRTCPLKLLIGKEAWRPFKASDENPFDRWPLYRDPVYGPSAPYGAQPYPDPAWVDDLNPATLPNEAPTLYGPDEVWTPSTPVTQSKPPLHPLARPDEN